jgi:hypothetical protein
MSLRSRTHLTLVGAAGAAAALAISTFAAPALAAGGSTASVNYTCGTAFGPVHPTAVYNVAAAPTKMVVGQPLKTKSTFTLDAATTGLATSALGWTKFSGTIQSAPSGSLAGLSLKIPKTPLGNGAAGTTVSHPTGSTVVGSKTGTFSLGLGSLDKVVLNGFDASGPKGSVSFPDKASSNTKCTNDATSTPLMAGSSAVTVKVGKDTTKTAESAKYSSKKHTATSTAKVKSKFGSKATGKVTFTLKKGSKTVKTAKGSLNKKGVATASFKKITAGGKYSITAKYAGSKTLTGSTGKASFKV